MQVLKCWAGKKIKKIYSTSVEYMFKAFGDFEGSYETSR